MITQTDISLTEKQIDQLTNLLAAQVRALKPNITIATYWIAAYVQDQFYHSGASIGETAKIYELGEGYDIEEQEPVIRFVDWEAYGKHLEGTIFMYATIDEMVYSFWVEPDYYDHTDPDYYNDDEEDED